MENKTLQEAVEEQKQLNELQTLKQELNDLKEQIKHFSKQEEMNSLRKELVDLLVEHKTEPVITQQENQVDEYTERFSKFLK